MPVYNQEQFVGDAVASVLLQTHEDFELIVVDDGSTDRTVDIVRAFEDPRIRVEGLDHHGIIHARGHGVRAGLRGGHGVLGPRGPPG